MVTLRKYALIIIGCVSLSSFSGLTVQASTWHKGTPKITRGNWVHRNYKSQVYTKIGKNYYHFESCAPIHMNKITYKKVGKNVYKFKGYEPIYAKKTMVKYFKIISKNHLVSYDSNKKNFFDFYRV